MSSPAVATGAAARTATTTSAEAGAPMTHHVIMFSGKTGTVARSGDVAATPAPTHQIIMDIFEEMDELEKRSPALFDKHAKHQPYGLLDKYGAAGMLVGDVVGFGITSDAVGTRREDWESSRKTSSSVDW